MRNEPDPKLALFIYGALVPGEMAWPFLSSMVSEEPQLASLEDHKLVLVDGIPTVLPSEGRTVNGSLAKLKNQTHFTQIARFENVGTYYNWAVCQTSLGPANVLVALGQPEKIHEIDKWNSAIDVYFGAAIPYGFSVLSELAPNIKSRRVDDGTEIYDFLKLQSLYGLYWTLFERILLFEKGATRGKSDTFSSRIREAQKSDRWLRAIENVQLSPIGCTSNEAPYDVDSKTYAKSKPFETWYCLRNNIVHRGKGAPKEVNKLMLACIDFHNVLSWYLQQNNESIRKKWHGELTIGGTQTYPDGLYIFST